MSLQIPIAFVDQTTANILLLSQQKETMLQKTTRPEPITGDRMFVERIGPKDAQPRGGRHSETPVSDAEHSRRALDMIDYVVPADLIDKPDMLKLKVDPQASYVQNQSFSLKRQKDDVIIAALFATVLGGHEGGTSIASYDVGESRLIQATGAIVTAGSDFTAVTGTPLTISKLLTCKQLLDDAEIDEERQRYFVANPYNINQFMNQTEVKSSDYNTSRVLAEGRIDSFLGFDFIRSTRLPADDTDTDATRCFAFAQDAIVMATPQDARVSIDLRPDLMNSIQIFSELSVGATRVEGPAVVQILLKTK